MRGEKRTQFETEKPKRGCDFEKLDVDERVIFK